MPNLFLLTEEQKDLQRMVRDFVKAEVIPHAAEWDKASEFPIGVYRQAVEMGLTTLTIPESLGGAGMGRREHIIVAEELGYGDAGFAIGVGAASLGIEPILLGGTDAQKAQAVDVLLKGGLAAFGLTEPEAGSNAAALRTTAVKDGDEYILNGSKCFITNGGLADLYTIFAVTDKEKGTKGISCFMVERDRKGLSVGKEEDKMGIRASNTASVILDDVRIPADHLVGSEGMGYRLAMSTLDRSRPNGNSVAVGIMQRALDLSVQYHRTALPDRSAGGRQGVRGHHGCDQYFPEYRSYCQHDVYQRNLRQDGIPSGVAYLRCRHGSGDLFCVPGAQDRNTVILERRDHRGIGRSKPNTEKRSRCGEPHLTRGSPHLL